MAINATSNAVPLTTQQTRQGSIVDDAIASVLGGGAPAPSKPVTSGGGLLQQLLGRALHGQQDAMTGVESLQQACIAWPHEPPAAQDHGFMPEPGAGPDTSPPDALGPPSGKGPVGPPPGKDHVGPPSKVGVPGQAPTPDTYTVRRGDNLSSIGQRVDRTWQQLYWANRDQIKHPDLIYPGQELTIPPADLQVPGFEYHPRHHAPGHHGGHDHPRHGGPEQGPVDKPSGPPGPKQAPRDKPRQEPGGPGKPPATRPPARPDDPPRPHAGEDHLAAPPPAPDGSGIPPAPPSGGTS